MIQFPRAHTTIIITNKTLLYFIRNSAEYNEMITTIIFFWKLLPDIYLSSLYVVSMTGKLTGTLKMHVLQCTLIFHSAVQIFPVGQVFLIKQKGVESPH